MLPLILASKSANRRQVLEGLGLKFTTHESNIDEKSITAKSHSERVKKIAEQKALYVAKGHQGIIIAADTYTVCERKSFEKPVDINEAVKMLSFLSGKQAVSRTGFCFLNTASGFKFLKTATTAVQFRHLSKKEILAIVAKYPVTNWAGAYALIDLYQLTLITKIRGSLTGLTHGLPTEYLIPLLNKEGFLVAPAKEKFQSYKFI